MDFDALSLLLALAVVFLPLLLAWHLLGRSERSGRRSDDNAPGGSASRRHR